MRPPDRLRDHETGRVHLTVRRGPCHRLDPNGRQTRRQPEGAQLLQLAGSPRLVVAATRHNRHRLHVRAHDLVDTSQMSKAVLQEKLNIANRLNRGLHTLVAVHVLPRLAVLDRIADETRSIGACDVWRVIAPIAVLVPVDGCPTEPTHPAPEPAGKYRREKVPGKRTTTHGRRHSDASSCISSSARARSA